MTDELSAVIAATRLLSTPAVGDRVLINGVEYVVTNTNERHDRKQRRRRMRSRLKNGGRPWV